MAQFVIPTKAFDPVGANFPQLVKVDGTNFPVSGQSFDAGTKESMCVELRALGYASGNVTVDVDWYAAATSNAVVWGAQLACQTPGDAQSVLTKSLATANTQTTTVNATANGPNRSTITVSNLDSIAADDEVYLVLYRDAAAGGDTMTGDAIAKLVTIGWT